MSFGAIFLAENDLHHLRSCREHLENRNFRVYTAVTPEEATHKLALNLVIDVAVIDIRLRDDSDEKDMSGLAVARLRPDIPKIILTVYPDYQTTRAALKRHLPIAHEYLAKKEGLPKLTTTIHQLLESNSLFNLEQSDINRTKLAEFMQRYFNHKAFNSLVLQLQDELRLRLVTGNLKQIAGEHRGINDQVKAVIGFLEQQNMLLLLLHLCRKLRPQVEWEAVVFPQDRVIS